MHVVRLAEPVVANRTVTFRWSVEPATSLYLRTSFELQFPHTVDISRVPASLWWRVALVCLHPHWAWIRPCRVVIPVRLAPGEREFWLRLIDAAVWSLEADSNGVTARCVDIVEAGPPLAPLAPGRDEGIVAACFSGGKDSLTQLALLQELGELPLLVTTTSPRARSVEHETLRRRYVMAEIVRRRGVELVEVTSDLRGSWDNYFLATRYGRCVNEVTDTFLYFAVALAVASARGARCVYLASEAEVQETVQSAGAILQHRHFMYSAVTQRALQALLEPTGIGYSALTYPLLIFQVQRLLASRFPNLRDLQYSCWEQAVDQSACSSCRGCFMNAITLLSEGVSPAEMGVDLATVLVAQRAWRPGGAPERPRGIVGRPSARHGDAHLLRCLRTLDARRVAEFLAPDSDAEEALCAFGELRDRALAEPEPEPEPGYRAGYLELVDERVRGGLEKILDEHFDRAPHETYEDLLERSRTLADWISAPLGRPQDARKIDNVPRTRSIPRPPSPAAPSADDLAPMRNCIPDPEPPLATPDAGRIIRVAETLLDGNELRYVQECVETNWVSSAGSFIPRFEAAFAQASGCRFGVATSSGANALHLMLAAAGIGADDEVIVPAFTMVATANAVVHVGAKPVFVDSDPQTWNVDPDRVAESIGPRTRAIVVVHTYGHPADVISLARLADANGLALLEDAAEAHGATYHGRRVGSLGAAAAFSFYGNKIITTGEGGMITTNDPAIASVARELRDHGFSTERHFWHRYRAFNYRMSNLQAAIGLAQVERLDKLVAARRLNARLYRERLDGIPGLTLPPWEEGLESAHWMFGVLAGDDFGCSRDELRRRLAAEGIETRTFFVPLHLQPAYLRDNAGRRHPVAEHLGRTGLYLPSGPSLTEADIDRIAAAVRRAGGAQVAGSSPSSAYSSPISAATRFGEKRSS